jgi:hypothetical protein
MKISTYRTAGVSQQEKRDAALRQRNITRLSFSERNLSNNYDRKPFTIDSGQYSCISKGFTHSDIVFSKRIPQFLKYIEGDLLRSLGSAEPTDYDELSEQGVAKTVEDSLVRSLEEVFGKNQASGKYPIIDYVSPITDELYKIFCEIKMVGTQNNIYSSFDKQDSEIIRLSREMKRGHGTIMVYIFFRYYPKRSKRKRNKKGELLFDKAQLVKWMMWRNID